MSAVLLQTSVGTDVEESVIELSPRQISSLGGPSVVRIEAMVPKKGSLPRIICEIKENSNLPDDACRVGARTLKIIAAPPNSCVRVTLLGAAKAGGEEKNNELKKREELLEALQHTLAKLTHERNWYKQVAERFRAELAATAEELDLAMEERQIAVSM